MDALRQWIQSPTQLRALSRERLPFLALEWRRSLNAAVAKLPWAEARDLDKPRPGSGIPQRMAQVLPERCVTPMPKKGV